jgi:hypothetical protein
MRKGKTMNRTIATLTAAAAMTSTSALADITVSAGASAPTYATTLNFDEPGTPTGVVSSDTWLVSHGVTVNAGDSVPQVDDYSTAPGQAWLGTDNSFFGNFGVFMTFENDVTEFSTQFWDPAGPGGPFGGGGIVAVFNDDVEVANMFYTPAWGGVGDEWINITTTGGMVFDEVRMLGFGFPNTSYIDNASWNAVPAPSAMALLGLGGIAAGRRRRA